MEKNIQIKVNSDGAKCKEKLNADWRIYQIVLFNVFQNAVKYNSQNGKIDIELIFKQCPSDQISSIAANRSCELETKIIDSGEGISAERIHHLFKPYGELKYYGKLKLVKHHGIGLGLSNSKVFMNFLGGKIGVTSSVPGHTEVTFTMPVQVDSLHSSINVQRNLFDSLGANRFINSIPVEHN